MNAMNRRAFLGALGGSAIALSTADAVTAREVTPAQVEMLAPYCKGCGQALLRAFSPFDVLDCEALYPAAGPCACGVVHVTRWFRRIS